MLKREHKAFSSGHVQSGPFSDTFDQYLRAILNSKYFDCAPSHANSSYRQIRLSKVNYKTHTGTIRVSSLPPSELSAGLAGESSQSRPLRLASTRHLAQLHCLPSIVCHYDNQRMSFAQSI